MMAKVTDNQINYPPQLLIYIKHVVEHKSTFFRKSDSFAISAKDSRCAYGAEMSGIWVAYLPRLVRGTGM